MHIRSLIARNTARSSPNKIHDETTARRYGFAGGLVPGVTVFAWMCGPPMDVFGETWLERGVIEARFVRPVYEGDEVVIEAGPGGGDALAISVRKGDEICASGRAAPEGPVSDPASFAEVPLPVAPPPAGPETLAPGRTLGSVEVAFEAGPARDYLAAIDADHPIPVARRVAHPGWLLLLANLSLASNVALGPWIHVSSAMQLLGTVADGQRVAAAARVTAEYERKGHRFVELDVVLVAGKTRPVATVHHAAIYLPRRPDR